MVPLDCTLAVTVRVADEDALTVPTVQKPVPLTYEPWLWVEDTNISPAGSRSLTVTFVAAFGPPLVSVIVKVTSWPTFGDELSTVLVNERSALLAVTTTLA